MGTACVPRVQPRVHAYTRELAARLCLCPCQCPRCCTPAPAALPFSVPPPNVALNSERGGVEDEGRGEKPLSAAAVDGQEGERGDVDWRVGVGAVMVPQTFQGL